MYVTKPLGVMLQFAGGILLIVGIVKTLVSASDVPGGVICLALGLCCLLIGRKTKPRI